MLGNMRQWSPREIIRQFEETRPSTKDYFTNNNKVIIFGQAETNLKWHHRAGNEIFYCVMLKVRNDNGKDDHIQVLISKHIMQEKQMENPFIGRFIEITGQYRSFDIILDGARQVSLFILAKKVSLFSKQTRIEKRMGKNAIFLDGYVADYPVIHFATKDTEKTELIMAVPGGYGKTYHIPCIMFGKYARLATTLKSGDYMSFYGYIQDKQHFTYKYEYGVMCEYCTTHEVRIVDIQTSPMFKRAKG